MSEAVRHTSGGVPELEDRMRKLMADQTGGAVSVEEIDWDTPLIGRGLGLTSLDSVSLMIRIENEFDVFLDAEEFASSLTSFGSLVEAIRSKIEAGPNGDTDGF
jgi:acyl carrier protein